MSIKIEIELNKKRKIYLPGQTVTCFVRIQLSKKTKVRHICGSFVGSVETTWRKLNSIGCDGDRYDRVYVGFEKIFDRTTTFLRSAKGESIVLDHGVHNYGPMEIHLPDNIPPSFTAKFGHIRYRFIFTFKRPKVKHHIVKEEIFYVRTKYNLNDYPRLREAKEVTHTFLIGFFATPIHVSLNLPRTGFIPGESILFCLKSFNESRIRVKKLKVTLINRITCFCTTPNVDKRVTNYKLAKVEFQEHIKMLEDRVMFGEITISGRNRFQFLLGVEVIRCEYLLRVTTVFRGLTGKKYFEVPIEIGNVAFEDEKDLEPVKPVSPGRSVPIDRQMLNALEKFRWLPFAFGSNAEITIESVLTATPLEQPGTPGYEPYESN